MTLQVENSTSSNRARVFNSIAAVFQSLPDRFKPSFLEKICGFSKSPYHRMLVSCVLQDDFKCRKVGFHNKSVWVKGL